LGASYIRQKLNGQGVIMMSVEEDELVHRINQMRKNLILIAKEAGLNSYDTLRYSQKLDELITNYQKKNNKLYTEFNEKSCIVT
jgi:acyl CoA:acetate/3-ketoacid CoA transferase alpha subunit